MRIAYIDQTGQLGGAEISLLDWLSAEHSEADLILFEDGPFRLEAERLGVQVKVLPMGAIVRIRRESGLITILRSIPHILRFAHRLRKATAQYKVIVANSQKAFLLSALVLRKGQRLIWDLNDILTKEHFSAYLIRASIFAANRLAFSVNANSQATADAYVAAGGDPSLVEVIYPGVDVAPFDQISPTRIAELRQELCPPGRFLLGIFGRLTAWKGHEVLFEAVATLPNVHLLVVGDALFGESAFKTRLIKRASRPDLADRVTFLGFREDLPAIMQAVDLPVHASSAPEPFGRVIVEAMLARKPVLATKAGGASEVARDGVDGLLVAPGSIAQLRAAIERFASDAEFARTAGAAARKRAEETFSLAIFVEAFNRLIQRAQR